jgi:hypothetical protein
MVAADADTQFGSTPAKCRAKVGRRFMGGTGIRGIVSGQDIDQQRRVGDIARKGTRVVQGPAMGNDA